MRLPKQSPPLKRPDLIQPHWSVDLTHGSIHDLLSIRIDLLHGANYNDPAVFRGMGGCNQCALTDSGILRPHGYASCSC